MEITLEKIELVKDRTGVSYKEAKEFLEANDGSVVDAIIAIEESFGENPGRKAEGSKVIKALKDIIRKGSVSRIVVKRDEEIMLNIPVNVGIVGVVIAPVASVIAVAASFGFKCVIEVVKEDGTIIDVSDRANDTIDVVVEKGAEIFDDVKNKSVNAYEKAKEKVADKDLDDIKEKGADIYAAGKDKAKDIASRFTSGKDGDKDAFVINIAEDIENAADILEEEMAEELESNVRIVDITEE